MPDDRAGGSIIFCFYFSDLEARCATIWSGYGAPAQTLGAGDPPASTAPLRQGGCLEEKSHHLRHVVTALFDIARFDEVGVGARIVGA